MLGVALRINCPAAVKKCVILKTYGMKITAFALLVVVIMCSADRLTTVERIYASINFAAPFAKHVIHARPSMTR